VIQPPSFRTSPVLLVLLSLSVGWGGNNVRFGDNADWRVKPIVKSGRHR
jgi:hypothetical protein